MFGFSLRFLSRRSGEAPQDLVQMLVDVGVLRGGAVHQAGAHVGVEGLAQVGGGRPHAAAPAVDGAAVGGGAQKVPQQRQDLLLHHLGLARVQLWDELWEEKNEGVLSRLANISELTSGGVAN